MNCFSCGTSIELASGERVGYRDACPRCGRDLHACRNCAHYAPGAYNECREPNAERVGDRERANRCDWFAPGERLVNDARAPDARAALDALFKKR